jgi:hypothetical protein
MSRRSSFSPKNYGHKKLGELLNDLKGSFTIKANENKTVMYVKNI